MGIRESLSRFFGRTDSGVPDEAPAEGGPPEHLFWAMRDLPMRDATQHFLVAGSPQSGKTITIRLLMQSVIPYVGSHHGHRAFIYDAKREFMPLLAEMWGKEPTTLDPFDRRGHPWRMAEDITTDADAMQLATMLVPEERHSSQRYFSDAARDLLRAVLVAFIESAPGRWTFRDVLLALENLDRLSEVVNQSDLSRRIAGRYLDDTMSLPGVVSTIATKLQPFSVVAALWASSPQRPVSLTEWLDTEGVLVVASHPRFSESLRPLNQAIFRRVSDLVLSRPDTEPDQEQPWRTWFFLDEVREAGQLDGLHPLLNMGRSKGACVVLGFQDIAGIKAAYEENIAMELVGQCAYKTFLRTGSHVTAAWAQEHFGQAEQIREHFSENESYDRWGVVSGSQASISYDYETQSALLASELLSLPAPGPDTGLIGYHDTPRHGAYRSHTPWAWVMDNLWKPSPEVVEAVPKVCPRWPAEQKLRPWEDDDERRLWPDKRRKKQEAERRRRRKAAPAQQEGDALERKEGHPTAAEQDPGLRDRPESVSPPVRPETEPDGLSGQADKKAQKKYDAKRAALFGIKPPDEPSPNG